MSSNISSDQIVKNEIINKVRRYNGITLRIFPQSSNQDQKLIEDGGLTFSFQNISYGSCDACWFKEIIDPTTCEIKEIPLIGLEGTDALNRGSLGNAQYQRFHHALGAVKNGCIGIYYLKQGSDTLQLDLYEMAYNATNENAHKGGAYLIIQDLSVVDEILHLIATHGWQSQQMIDYIKTYVNVMHQSWYKQKFSKYGFSWDTFAQKRSTIIKIGYIIKIAGRMRRNFTDGSQRAGHIAVGEMYLSKYLFPNKTVFYLCPRMTDADVAYLDTHKQNDKEWFLLRNETNVCFKTRDSLLGLPPDVRKMLEEIENVPLKFNNIKTYHKCFQIIEEGLRNDTITLK